MGQAKLILGLGNPGKEYARTRHNAGFLTVGVLAQRWRVPLKKDRSTFSLTGSATVARQRVVLAEPVTYMNLSGIALNALRAAYKFGLSDILVVCDDLDLSSGTLRVRERGSTAGHHGLQSVASALGTKDFCRLRIGIGRPPEGTDPAEYVLSDFSRTESETLAETVSRAGDCCELWVAEGIVECMNAYNKKSKVKS